jgi:hypothetical protein
MTVQDLIELLSKQRPTKRIYNSSNAACVELKPEDIADLPWGIVIK